jgi:hypothetical protein
MRSDKAAIWRRPITACSWDLRAPSIPFRRASQTASSTSLHAGNWEAKEKFCFDTPERMITVVELSTDGGHALRPGAFDQRTLSQHVAGLGDAAATSAALGGMLGGDPPRSVAARRLLEEALRDKGLLSTPKLAGRTQHVRAPRCRLTVLRRMYINAPISAGRTCRRRALLTALVGWRPRRSALTASMPATT